MQGRLAKLSRMTVPSILRSTLILFLASTLTAQDQAATTTGSPRIEVLRQELLKMAQQDQESRQRMIDWAAESKKDWSEYPGLEELNRLDAANLARLKQIVDRHGWPVKSIAGSDGANAAWLVLQHATGDRPFQKRCLKLMQAAPKAEVSQVDVAYLVDRIRIADGQKQLYGTQLDSKDGRFVVSPVEAPDYLAERRAAIGLEPIDKYIQSAEEAYKISRSPK